MRKVFILLSTLLLVFIVVGFFIYTRQPKDTVAVLFKNEPNTKYSFSLSDKETLVKILDERGFMTKGFFDSRQSGFIPLTSITINIVREPQTKLKSQVSIGSNKALTITSSDYKLVGHDLNFNVNVTSEDLDKSILEKLAYFANIQLINTIVLASQSQNKSSSDLRYTQTNQNLPISDLNSLDIEKRYLDNKVILTCNNCNE